MGKFDRFLMDFSNFPVFVALVQVCLNGRKYDRFKIILMPFLLEINPKPLVYIYIFLIDL